MFEISMRNPVIYKSMLIFLSDNDELLDTAIEEK